MRRHNFTLIELLTVIAIIAILAGMLLPAIGRARVSAIQNKCLSAMGQLGKADAMFGADHKNKIAPSCDFNVDYYSLPAALYEYVGKEAEAFTCPDDEVKASTASSITYDSGKTFGLDRLSYLPNRNIHIGTTPSNSKVWMNLSRVDAPSRIISLAESSAAGAGSSGVTTALSGSNVDTAVFNLAAHGNTRSNYLYLDGHAEAMDEKDATVKFKAGENGSSTKEEDKIWVL